MTMMAEPRAMATEAPHNLDAERNLLGATMMDREAFVTASEHVTAASFYSEKHRAIFRAMEALAGRAEPIDLVNLSEELVRAGRLETVGGEAYLLGLMDDVPTSAYAESYARNVREKADRRALIDVAGKALADAYDLGTPFPDVLNDAEAGLVRVSKGVGGIDFQAPAGPVAEALTALRAAAETPGGITGLATGFKELDGLTHGFQPGSLVLIAARPSIGKTAFAMNIAAHAALKLAKHVGVVSLEMGAADLMKRLLASEARVDVQRVANGTLSERDWRRLEDVAVSVTSTGLYINDAPDTSLASIRSAARRWHARGMLDLLIVDYVQLMGGGSASGFSGGGENRNLELAGISRGFKRLAMELRIPVVVLAQLSREVEKRPNKRPMLSDLRDSGALEQDADLVIFLYRDEYYDPNTEKHGIAEVIIGKQRNGPTGTIEVQFHGAHVRFNDLARSSV